MSKIARVKQLIFGSNAGANQMAKFGSLAAGAPFYTSDPSAIQSLSNYLTGWFGAIVGSNSPAIEDMNALNFLHSYQLAYLMQSGVAEYDATTTYYVGSMVNSSGSIFVSLTDNNTGNALTNTTNWKIFGNGSRTVTTTVTALATDEIIRADATTASFTVTLPTIASSPFKRITVKCVNTNSNFVTVAGNGSELIEGANLFPSLNTYESVTFYNNGTAWEVVTSNTSKVPTGTILAHGGATIPKGFLLCNGASISTTTYANLYAAIGYVHGGSGSSFNIPDHRGRFLRGVDGGAGNDPDRASRTAMNTGGNTGDLVGSIQSHQTLAHSHTVYRSGGGANIKAGGGNGSSNYALNFIGDAAGFDCVTDTIGGNETRPKNANVNFIIKY